MPRGWRSRLSEPRQQIDAVRRRAAMAADRAWAVAHPPRPRSVAFDGDPRFAVVTVNFSTTHYLKLMLLTLSEQEDLGLIRRIVVVDNGSRDDAARFLTALGARVSGVDVVSRRHWLHHGPGMRAGVHRLDTVDVADPKPANVLLFVDPDVIFLNPGTLRTVADAFVGGAALVGEVRRGRHAGPNIQASFFAVRRDVYARRDVRPPVHDGAPAYRLQLSVERAGFTVADLASNRGGFILHRGRSGVAAASTHRRRHAYATARRNTPHFMGVRGGAVTWAAIEAKYAPLLAVGREEDLVRFLVARLSVE